MSTSIRYSLWSHSWDPVFASPSFKFYRRPLKSLNLGLHTTRCPFSQSRLTSKNGGLPKQALRRNPVRLGISLLETASAVPRFGAMQGNKYRYGTHLSYPNDFAFGARQACTRKLHSNARGRDSGNLKRHKSSTSKSASSQTSSNDDRLPSLGAEKKTESLPEATTPPGKYLHLPHMPKMPHRPTKEELLAAATGFWSRLKVRFKWFSIRSVRPWNIDDWSAFVSWFVLGNIVWILVGTTTFFSLLIFSINTVVAQGTITTIQFVMYRSIDWV